MQHSQLAKEILGVDFFSTITQKLHIENEATNIQEEILSSLGENIFQRITIEVLGKLDANDRAEAEKLVDQDTTTPLFEYLRNKIPDFSFFVRDVANDEILTTLKLMKTSSVE